MEPSIKQEPGSSVRTNRVESPTDLILAGVDPSSLEMVLDLITRKNCKSESNDESTRSLQVHGDWMLSQLEGDDEATEPLYHKQEDGKSEREVPKVRYTKGTKSDPEEQSELIREAIDRIKEDFKSVDGFKFKPYGLGVGRKLSKLLETIKQDGDSKNGASQSTKGSARKLPDPDSAFRGKRAPHLAPNGKPRS
ncbi:unnamed protein product [Rhizoctonia solani]|uniref:Uncharacterized protein n=1 Tax=Rhizoctonia solani TaxID=456999 RepID=A0A8H3CXV8_9AGAM|nr:unnamed protein product [Rhizoctonia solani]